jgi:hypothetical protein
MYSFILLPYIRQGSNRVSRSTPAATTFTTISTELNFPAGPTGALDEDANVHTVSVLKQIQEFTMEDRDGGAGGSGWPFGELVISKPHEFQNKSFTSYLVELQWTERLLTQIVEESFYAGKHMVFCRKQDTQLAIVSNTISFCHHYYQLIFSPG